MGVVPLVLSGSTLQFLGDPGSDYNDVICNAENSAAVIIAAVSGILQSAGWTNCRLRNVPAHSRLFRSLPELPLDLRRDIVARPTSIRSAITLEQNRSEIIRAARRKPMLRRHVNKLNSSGRVVFRHIEDRDEAHDHLERLFRLHIERRAITGERSQFLNDDFRTFYHSLLEEIDRRHTLRFSVLELDGCPVAYHFGFENNGKFVMYKVAFDINCWEYSPGDVLLSNLLAYADARHILEYDFTIGSEHYKKHFANTTATVYSLSLYGSPLSRVIRSRFELAHARVMSALCASPTVRRIRSLVRRAKTLLLAAPAAFGPDAVTYRLEGSRIILRSCDNAAELASIGDLARLALDFPVLLDGARLQDYRRRLRSGDHCYLVRDTGSVQLAWLGKRTEVNSGSKPVAVQPAIVLYDVCRLPRCSRGPVDPPLLNALLHRAHIEGVDAYFYSASGNDGWQREIRALGFVPFEKQC